MIYGTIRVVDYGITTAQGYFGAMVDKSCRLDTCLPRSG